MCDIWLDVDAAVTVPVNLLPLIAVADFKAVLASETYNEAGLELIWNFVTTAGVQTHVAVTPTDTGGDYDWVNVGHGMYNIEIPASGGASANNDTEGFGWFTGVATDALPWRGPVIGFRAAALNNALIDGGDTLDVNVTEISGDSTAADNSESFFDGTGYAGTNNVIPTVTTLTGHTAQTGDAYAVVAHADYGNAKLVRSTTPANTLTVDASHQALALTNAITNDAITAAAIANGAIDNGAFAADAISAAKIAADVTTELQSGLATSAELAKVPKSDSNVTWNATALASLQQEATDALNAYDPPTNAEMVARTLVAASYFDPAADVVAHVTLVDTTTTNTDMITAAVIADAVWDEASAGHTDAGKAGQQLWTDVDAILVDTAEIGVAGAGLTAIDLPNQTMDITGNITGNLSGSVGSVTGAVGSVTGAVGSVTGNVGGNVTGSVGSVAGNVTGSVGSVAAGGITAASIATDAIDADALAADGLAEIADAVWDEALAGHAGAGTAGAALSAASAPTAAAVADAVWDEAIAGHLGAGSTGAALNAAGAAGDPWTTALPGAYGAGTAGDIIGNLVTDIGALTPAVAISATTAASVSTGALAVRTHHSLSQAISSTYAGNLAAATKLWLAVKAEKDDTDAQSVIFIEETAGLTVLAGAVYATVAHGTLVVGGLAGAWTVTVALDEVATGLLTAYADGMLWAECKALVAGSTVAVWDGVCDVSRGIVNAVT